MEIQSLKFPNSSNEPFTVKSPATYDYNCIAWAVEITDKSFWPEPAPYSSQVWPKNIPFEETLDAFIKFYESFGFEKCDNADYKEEYLKIAIYTKKGVPQHAARQLNETEWTSKLGSSHDVRHTLESMKDGYYGNVSQFMRKRITKFRRRLIKG